MGQSAEKITGSALGLNPTVWFFAGQVDESQPVQHVSLHTLPFRVGRRADLGLSLPCSCVSKEHAEIFEHDGSLWVKDLQSTNGTYVNGQRVEDEAPLTEGDILQFATVVFRVGREQRHVESGTIREDTCDRALAMMQFDRLFNDGAVVPFYQPIVRVDETQEAIGFEVLGRSRLFGLKTPAEMFATASRLNLEAELSRVFRLEGVRVGERLPSNLNLFVNTHPIELVDKGLFESLKKIRELCPERPMTLEIHEAAVTDPDTISTMRSTLDDLNIQLAFDDFGAGQARLVELSEIRPDYLKFDMKLVQGIHRASPSRQEVVALLVQMVNELGIASLAEGVETKEEHETLRQMGFQLGQGYLYGRPASISTYAPRDDDTDHETV